MAAATSEFRISQNRILVTYEPQGWPVGLLTGYAHDGGFFLEYVMVLPRAPLGTLRQLLRGGIETAWSDGYRYIALELHDDHPHCAMLARLAARFGFKRYHEASGIERLVLYKGRSDEQGREDS